MSATLEWILASGSPRRQEILTRLNPRFRVLTSHADEWEPAEADPKEQVLENACRKGQVVAEGHPQALVIAADTTVALGRRIFGKPADRHEATRMLEALSGREHRVLTGVALYFNGKVHAFAEESRVRFLRLDASRIDLYLEAVHVYDKAGAYAIQESADLIIEGFDGSFENIMGLPIQRLREELVQLGWVALPITSADA